MTETIEIFDRALDLEKGQTLTIKCEDERDMNSLRVSLYGQRRRWLDSVGLIVGEDIQISRETTESGFFVALTKRVRRDPAIITDEHGEVIETFDPRSAALRNRADELEGGDAGD